MTAELRRNPTTPAEAAASWEAEIGSVRVHFGPGRLRQAGEIVERLGCRRVLLVSDAGLQAAGHLTELQGALERAGLEVFTFTDLSENPTTRQVGAGLQFAAPLKPDCVVGLGGGSAMDCAKGINFLLTNGGKMSDYWGFGQASRELLPAIGIPTTAGTGSEAQSFALITDAESHRKMACGDPTAMFRAVVLDPNLLSSAPTEVAAATGLDAVSHAIESFVSTRRNPVSRMLASQAWQLLHLHLDDSLAAGASPETRGHVLLAAHLAGAAIEQSMLGAAHACANPLTAAFAIPHGQAVALMLPHVVRFNAEVAASDFKELLEAADLHAPEDSAEALALRIEEMRRRAGLPGSLGQLQVPGSAIRDLAAAATDEWTTAFNPRAVGRLELEALYESAL